MEFVVEQKNENIMKKIFTSLFIAALALTAAVSCDKNNETSTEADGKELALTFTADGAALSRTELDATGKKANWVEGDAIQFAYYKNGTGWAAGWDHSNAEATIGTDGKASFKFTSWVNSTITSLDFWFIYPYAGQTGISSKVEDGVWSGFIVPAEQTPTLTSFDGKADILVGQHILYESTAATDFTIKFIRKSGFMKIKLAGISDALAAKEVKSVTVAAQEGAALAGTDICVKIDTTVDGTTADPYSIYTDTDSEPTNVLVADYSAKNITVADLQSSDENKGVWLSMLPSEIKSLKVTVVLKDDSTIEFAERATAGMEIAENEITPITLTFDDTKGDKATIETSVAYILTITSENGALAAAVTTEDGTAVETDAIETFGLATNIATGSEFYISTSNSTGYLRNTKPIGKYITKIAVTAKNSSNSYYYKLGTSTEVFTSNSGTNKNGDTETEFAKADGIQYFNISKTSTRNKTAYISKVVINYIGE